MMAIARLNWGEVVAAQVPWSPAGWTVRAIWPSPVDHDACFAAAGFDDFADSDEVWDADFRAIVSRLLVAFASRRLELLSGEFPGRKGGRANDSLVDALLTAAHDDNFPSCVVGDRGPPTCRLCTGAGHPIIWVAQPKAEAPFFLELAAGPLELRNITLDWAVLVAHGPNDH